MSDITTITSKVRALLGDLSIRGNDPFIYGSSDIFTLTEDNIDEVTTVFNGDTELDSGDWIFETTTNKLTLSNSGNTAGDVIDAIYTYFPNHSDSEIESYIKAALVHLSTSNVYTFVEEEGTLYPEATDKEINLIALIASVLIDPKNLSYRLPDISVIIPSGTKDMTPIEQIRRIIASYKKDSKSGAGIWGLL